MASKILLKKSTTASAVPTTNDLATGEVALNTEDKLQWMLTETPQSVVR